MEVRFAVEQRSQPNDEAVPLELGTCRAASLLWLFRISVKTGVELLQPKLGM